MGRRRGFKIQHRASPGRLSEQRLGCRGVGFVRLLAKSSCSGSGQSCEGKLSKNAVNLDIKDFFCFLCEQCLATNNCIPPALSCPG